MIIVESKKSTNHTITAISLTLRDQSRVCKSVGKHNQHFLYSHQNLYTCLNLIETHIRVALILNFQLLLKQ